MLRQPPDSPGPARAVPAGPADQQPEAAAGSAAVWAPTSPYVLRFTRAVRWCHRGTAVLMGLCLGSALFLYVPAFAQLVGRRALVVFVHEWSGILLPLPVLLGLASRSLRADLRTLNRFGPHDRRWLRRARRARRPYPRSAEDWGEDAGKFNAGQKVFAAWISGSVLVMAGTGTLMWFTGLAPLVWRTSATFVHDWLALAIGGVLAGHVAMAMADPEAREAMRSGRARRSWARREHALWAPSEDPDGHGRE